MVDAKVHTRSKWKLDGNGLRYRIEKCSIARDGNTIDKCVCHIVNKIANI